MVSQRSSGWWTAIVQAPGSHFTVSIPMCDACKPEYLRESRLLKIVAYSCVTAAIIGGIAIRVSNVLPTYCVLILAVVMVIPIMILRRSHTPCFELIPHAGSVDYRFSDSRFAEDFAHLNPGGDGRLPTAD